jgi:penicillin-binding protein 1A
MRDGRPGMPAQARRRRTSTALRGSDLEGGSIIAQQLATRILGYERTLSHMPREAVAAMWLSKDEIVTRYLTSVYLGNGAYGMPAAAWIYFDKRPAELTLPEAAMLAGPDPQPLARQSVVESRTEAAGAAVVIDLRQITALLKEPLRARPQSRPLPSTKQEA